jgi:MFS family permease
MTETPDPAGAPPQSRLARLPFFYGWVVVAVAFVTMGIGVNARTAFSLLFPPILEEFHWERGVTAAAFSIGFFSSILISPYTGRLVDRFGPRLVIPAASVIVAAGLALATAVTQPWHLYLTLGVMVVGASVLLSYIGHSLFVPLWFVRRRGLAVGIAFSGVGVGSVLLFPWVQTLINAAGWRQACWTLAILMVAILVPLNFLLQRHKPQDLGLEPDGDARPAADGSGRQPVDTIVDREWTAIDWTVRRAMRTARFWWLVAGFSTGLYSWYAIQVHQTRYLTENGFSSEIAAFALGLVGLTGIAGQIGLGALSDRIGREWAWTLSGLGYVACYVLLLLIKIEPSPLLMYLMVAAQGALGYGLASVYGAIPAEMFQGRHYGSIFGVLAGASIIGGGWRSA